MPHRFSVTHTRTPGYWLQLEVTDSTAAELHDFVSSTLMGFHGAHASVRTSHPLAGYEVVLHVRHGWQFARLLWRVRRYSAAQAS